MDQFLKMDEIPPFIEFMENEYKFKLWNFLNPFEKYQHFQIMKKEKRIMDYQNFLKENILAHLEN